VLLGSGVTSAAEKGAAQAPVARNSGHAVEARCWRPRRARARASERDDELKTPDKIAGVSFDGAKARILRQSDLASVGPRSTRNVPSNGANLPFGIGWAYSRRHEELLARLGFPRPYPRTTPDPFTRSDCRRILALAPSKDTPAILSASSARHPARLRELVPGEVANIELRLRDHLLRATGACRSPLLCR